MIKIEKNTPKERNILNNLSVILRYEQEIKQFKRYLIFLAIR